MSLNCPIDSFYPKCDPCKPHDADVCPNTTTGGWRRAKAARIVGRGYNKNLPAYIGAFATDIDKEPYDLPAKVIEGLAITTQPLTNRRFEIPTDGKTLKVVRRSR